MGPPLHSSEVIRILPHRGFFFYILTEINFTLTLCCIDILSFLRETIDTEKYMEELPLKNFICCFHCII